MLTASTLTDGCTHHVEAFGTKGELAGTATPASFFVLMGVASEIKLYDASSTSDR
jgi:hypothetical protein